MGMVWLIFQIKHLEGKDKPVGWRFDASNLETHSRNSLRGNIHKKGGTRFPVLLCKMSTGRTECIVSVTVHLTSAEKEVWWSILISYHESAVFFVQYHKLLLISPSTYKPPRYRPIYL